MIYMGNSIFNHFIFFPPVPRTVEDHVRFGEGYDPSPSFYLISQQSDNTAKIFVAEVKPKKMRPGAAPIIWSYGNGCDIYTMLPTARRVAMYLQSPVYLYDYPGYGQSGGEPSEGACIEALQEVIGDVIRRNKLAGGISDIIFMGQSLGTAITVGALFRYPHSPKQVVLISPFTSIPAVANVSGAVQMGYTIMGGDTFATCNRIGAVCAPIKIYHGKQDELIPYLHSVELQKLNPKTRLVLVPHADHNNILSKIDLSELLH